MNSFEFQPTDAASIIAAIDRAIAQAKADDCSDVTATATLQEWATIRDALAGLTPTASHRAAVAEATRLQQALSDLTGRYEALLRDSHPAYSVDNAPPARRRWIAAEFERLTDDLGTVEADLGDPDGKAYSWLIVARSRVRVLSDLWLSIYPEIQQSGVLDAAAGTEWEGASLVTQLRSFPAAPPGIDAMAVTYPARLMEQAANEIVALQAKVTALTEARRPVANPEGERLYRERLSRSLASLDPEDRKPAALADCIRFVETWMPDAMPATDEGQISFGRSLLESALDTMRATLADTPDVETLAKVCARAIADADITNCHPREAVPVVEAILAAMNRAATPAPAEA